MQALSERHLGLEPVEFWRCSGVMDARVYALADRCPGLLWWCARTMYQYTESLSFC